MNVQPEATQDRTNPAQSCPSVKFSTSMHADNNLPQDPAPIVKESAATDAQASPHQTHDAAGPAEAGTQHGEHGKAILNPAECAQRLKQLFPALFSGAPKPLKLRIQADIQERAPGVFSKQLLSAFFRRYTGSTSYLLASSKAKHRFDLDGAPAGEFSEEHRQVAVQELARRRALQEERRELEENQRRNRAGLLRSYETTTLTRTNFCALMGVAPDELDGLLALAREEAQQRTQQPGARPRPAHPGGPHQARQGRAKSR